MEGAQNLQSWKRHMNEGNDYFNAHKLSSALTHYLKAIELAELLFYTSEDPKTGVALLIVSHHNLADLYSGLHRYKQAEEELRVIHKRFTELLDEIEPDSMNADALAWGVSKTYIALITHLKNYPNKSGSQTPRLPNLFNSSFKQALN